MGFFRKDKNEQWSLFKKKRTKPEEIGVSDILDDNDGILTMPDHITTEGLITKPFTDNTSPALSTSESILPFTAPVEDLNFAEAEMLNKMEAEQTLVQDTPPIDEPVMADLDQILAEELVNDSEEIIDMLGSVPQVDTPNTTPNEPMPDNQNIQDAQLSRMRQRQAFDQLLSNGSTNNNATLTPEQVGQIFSSQPTQLVEENLTPTQKVNNIFGKVTMNDSPQTKSTPTQLVHSVFGKEEKQTKANDVPSRDIMRQMLSSQKPKTNNAIPNKSELFKTITKKDE